MRDAHDDSTAKLAAAASAIALAVGVFMGLFIMAAQGSVILAFVMLSVVPSLLGYAGLSRTGYLPWQREHEREEDETDLLEELKRRYAAGDIDDDDLERKIETLLAAEETRGRDRSREREHERERVR